MSKGERDPLSVSLIPAPTAQEAADALRLALGQAFWDYVETERVKHEAIQDACDLWDATE